MIYDNVLDLIGNTPIVRVAGNNGNTIFCKLEYFSPSGSIKDRAALSMITNMLKDGTLKEGGTVIEATSGNTGIGMSLIAAALKLKAVVVMPENMSEERIKYMRSLGAEVVLTKADLGMKGASKKANEILAKTPNCAFLNQFSNKYNPLAHYEHTAPEIYRDVPDLDYFVCACGSCGTISGIARYIKDNGLKTKVIAVEPNLSPLLSKGYSAPHKIQGIGANFKPKNFDESLVDGYLYATNEEAYEYTKLLNCSYGITCGISGGAVFACANKLEVSGKKILVLIPDNSLRYLSTPNLF